MENQPDVRQVSIFDIIQIRIGLDNVKETPETAETIATLDKIILSFAKGLN